MLKKSRTTLMVKQRSFLSFVFLFTVLFLFFSGVVVFTFGRAFGRIENLGREGAVYDIVEKDAMQEIEERLAKVDIEAIKKSLRKSVIDKLSNINIPGIGKAVRDDVRTFRPIYTLPFDIRDEKGRVIYPKGYTFNPLQLFSFPYIFVFIDGSSKKEIDWFLNNSGLSNRWDIIVMITKGSVFDTWSSLGRYVFAADKHIVNWLQVRRTPSVVYASGDYFVVVEYGIHGRARR